MKLKFVSYIVLLSAFILTCSQTVVGQATATLADNELLMGNIGKLEVLVPLPNDSAQVEFPLLSRAKSQKLEYVGLINDSIELRVAHKKALEKNNGKYFMRYDLAIQAFDSGRYKLPSLEFIVAGENVKTNPLDLSVLPVKVKSTDKLDDFTSVSEPFELYPDSDQLEEEEAAGLTWLWISIVIVLLILLGSYLFFRKKGGIFKFRAPLSPYEQAIDKLNKLEKQHLPERGRTKEYYTRLSEILRTYLKRQFEIKTFEKTSSEILMQVSLDEQLSKYENVLKSIFETSDFVKFAKVNPSETENKRCIQEALRFIEASHPQEINDQKKGGNK